MGAGRAVLLGIVGLALVGCQTYEGSLHDAKLRDTRKGDVRGVDRSTREASTSRDALVDRGQPAADQPGCGAPTSCAVLFSYDKGSESKVELFGSFNSWSSGVAMTLVGAQWQTTMTLSNGQQVLYKFVLDGTTWIPDPKNPKQTTDSNHNSILDVVCLPSCG
jgi:hypothetical protein